MFQRGMQWLGGAEGAKGGRNAEECRDDEGGRETVCMPARSGFENPPADSDDGFLDDDETACWPGTARAHERSGIDDTDDTHEASGSVSESAGRGREGIDRRSEKRMGRVGAVGAAGSCACALAFGTAAHGGIVAHWNLNGIVPASSTVVAADLGSGILDFTSVGPGASTLLGTTVGAPKGVVAGDSLSVAGLSLNGQAVELTLDATGWVDLSLSFATRRSATGFANSRLEWWNGSAWDTVEAFSASTTAWELRSFDLGALDALENGSARLRIVIDGATGSTGSIRFDNFTVSGSTVPVPAGAWALLALAGCAARRKR